MTAKGLPATGDQIDQLAAAHAQTQATLDVLVAAHNILRADHELLLGQVNQLRLELESKAARVQSDIASAQAKVLEATKPENVDPVLRLRVLKRKRKAAARARRVS